jgi:hypothetical protein
MDSQPEVFRPVGSKQRPEHYSYGLRGLLGFPSRLFRPLHTKADSEEAAPASYTPKSEKPVDTEFKVGKPRTFAKTPANQIALKDVLEK